MNIAERRIVFDLTHFQTDCISQKDLLSLAKHLKFESILQYVELCRLSVEKTDSPSPKSDGPSPESATGNGDNGRTPLQAAAESGHLDIVESLLTANANVNAAAGSSYGQTALQAAAAGGHLKVVQRLLVAKADVNAAAGNGGNGRTALQAAAAGGHFDVVDMLLAANANVNATADGCGRTALEAAAEGGHLDVVQRLLAAKADVNGDGLPPKSEPRKGLDHFKIIFDWLWDNGVRRILKVRVHDDGDTSHSDEIIENTLNRFQVEVWDWKKFDLCSETIFKAAPDVREISLYSSGNNAILRSWSCEDGLAKLKKVRFP